MNSRKTKLPVESASSLLHVSCRLSSSRVSPSAGQYLWHFVRPLSTSVVTMTTNVLPCSTTICQKSRTVEFRGPVTVIQLAVNNCDTQLIQAVLETAEHFQHKRKILHCVCHVLKANHHFYGLNKSKAWLSKLIKVIPSLSFVYRSF